MIMFEELEEIQIDSEKNTCCFELAEEKGVRTDPPLYPSWSKTGLLLSRNR